MIRIAMVVLAVGLAGAARAAEPEPPPEHRGLSLLLNAGQYSAFGAGLGFGNRTVGVRASAGWSPLLLVEEQGSSSSLKFYSSWMVAPDVYARLLSPQPTSDIGAQAGYRYDSLLGHGLAVGGYGQIALSRSLDANVSIGFLVYPDGENRLKREKNLPSSTGYSFPGPNFSFVASVGLAFFP